MKPVVSVDLATTAGYAVFTARGTAWDLVHVGVTSEHTLCKKQVVRWCTWAWDGKCWEFMETDGLQLRDVWCDIASAYNDIDLVMESPFVGKFPSAALSLAERRGKVLAWLSLDRDEEISVTPVSPPQWRKGIAAAWGARFTKDNAKLEALSIVAERFSLAPKEKYYTHDVAEAVLVGCYHILNRGGAINAINPPPKLPTKRKK